MIMFTMKRWKLIFKEHMDAELEMFCSKISLILKSFPALEG